MEGRQSCHANKRSRSINWTMDACHSFLSHWYHIGSRYLKHKEMTELGECNSVAVWPHVHLQPASTCILIYLDIIVIWSCVKASCKWNLQFSLSPCLVNAHDTSPIWDNPGDVTMTSPDLFFSWLVNSDDVIRPFSQVDSLWRLHWMSWVPLQQNLNISNKNNAGNIANRDVLINLLIDWSVGWLVGWLRNHLRDTST